MRTGVVVARHTRRGVRTARLLTLFEDRYGAGSHQRLLALLGQPCDVRRNRGQFGRAASVRQWHTELMAPTAAAAAVPHPAHRRAAEAAVPTFYRHARPYVSPGRIQLVRARDGFRTRSVRLDDRTVAIRRAGQPGSAAGPTAYRLHRYRGSADFVYYHLAGSDYLFLPAMVIPRWGEVFRDEPASGYRRFKNTFDALKEISLSM